MRPLVIGAVQREQIAALRALAADNVMDPEAMKTAAAKDVAAYRQMMTELSIELPSGYLVTYSHERQPDPAIGLVQHISVSVDAPNRGPHPAAMNMILAAFGMQTIEQSLKVWIEDVSRTEKAINVVQRL
jgi:hypothetical protein